MGSKEFEIVLDSPVYYAGQNLTGKLFVGLKKPKKIKGLYLKYFGKGSVQWSEGSGTTTVTHSKTEVYLMLCQPIFGNGTEESELAEGRHVFDFNCQLPTELPCSFEGLFGRIRYSVKAVIDEPWRKDYVAKQSLKIMSIFDLNSCPVAATSIEEMNSKTFWGQSKPLFMSVDIPIRGFVPGQIIPIKVTLNNESEVQVKSIVAKLKQNIVFYSATKSSPMKESLLKSETPVEKGFGNHEIALNVETPELSPSCLQFSNIIDNRYELSVKAKVSGCHRSLKISTEVIIGNVPLMGYEIPFRSQRFIPQNLLQSQPPPYAVVLPPPITYEDMPPPSYEQSTRPGSDEERNSGNEIRGFSPFPFQISN